MACPHNPEQYSHTSNNYRLGSAFDYLDPRPFATLVMMSSQPPKIWGCQLRITRSNRRSIDCPIQSRLQSVLGLGSSFFLRRTQFHALLIKEVATD